MLFFSNIMAAPLLCTHNRHNSKRGESERERERERTWKTRQIRGKKKKSEKKEKKRKASERGGGEGTANLQFIVDVDVRCHRYPRIPLLIFLHPPNP